MLPKRRKPDGEEIKMLIDKITKCLLENVQNLDKESAADLAKKIVGIVIERIEEMGK